MRERSKNQQGDPSDAIVRVKEKLRRNEVVGDEKIEIGVSWGA